MGAEAGLVRPARVAPHVPFRAAVLGLGSVFGKTLRDSRGPAIVVTALLGAMIVMGGQTMATTYGSVQQRLELDAMARTMPPEMRGFYGDPVNVGTLGGFLSWHYAAYFALLAGLWSILALSATIAGEARRGNLDLTVATPHSRRGIALEKIAGHVVAMAICAALLGIAAVFTGSALGTLPGDEIPADAAASFAVGLAIRALAAGSIAFGLAPLLGRGAAAGIAGAVMVGGYVVDGYQAVVPAFESVAGLTWWSWAAGHVPLAGVVDWAGIGVTLAVALAFLVLGVETFARRDIGVTIRIPTPALPAALLGVRGPVGRALGDILPGAFWWSVGLAAYGLMMAAASGALVGLLETAPALGEAFRSLIPGIDLTTAAGFLQLAFVDLGFVFIGLAATTFVHGRWADESAGRLEMQLATPLTRSRWTLAAGVATWAAIVAITALLAIAIAVGIASIGQDPITAATGTLVLGLYGIALAGIGMAAGGLLGPAAAAPVVAAVAVGTFILDTLAPILGLPDWVAQLAVTTHLGEPLIGRWDPAGIVACLVLALGGLIVGAWGMGRRDVGD